MNMTGLRENMYSTLFRDNFITFDPYLAYYFLTYSKEKDM